MQYCNTLDDYESLMLKNNAGDYPCSWLLGDMNTNEIMILELGLNHHNKKITKNGIYYGMNSVMDPKMRVLETNDISHKDNNESSGSRNLRLRYLLFDKYKGKLNVSNAKTVLSDHYDSRDQKQ